MHTSALRASRAAHPRGATVLVAALALLAALVAAPTPAFAHAHLKSASPAAGTRLTATPSALVLTFSEAPALAMSALQLLGPDSTAIALGSLNHDAGPRTLGAAILGALVAGRYTVTWQTAGDDGHVQRGSYQFVIAEGAAGTAPLAPPASVSAARPTSAASVPVARADSGAAPLQLAGLDASSPIYVVIRWVQFAALLLLIGAVAFRWWLFRRAAIALDEPSRAALSASVAGTGLLGAWLLMLTAIARLFVQAATVRSGGGMAGQPGMGPMLTGTEWGHGWLLEAVAGSVALLCLHLARRSATSTWPWRAAAAATAGLGFVPALSGHAIAERTFAPFTVLFDGAHVLAAGAWLGGLAVMIFVGIPSLSRALRAGAPVAVHTLVNAFSPLALTSAAVLVFSGIVAARLHVASWSAFTATSYGRTLLIKLALVLVLMLVGGWNWRRVKPALESDAYALARSARLELALGVVVLLVTAVLVALPTPAELVR